MGPVQHQWFADALAAESVTNQTNPKLPVLRHIPIALAPVPEAPNALPGGLAEHRNRGRLITVCNFRPGGVAKKPAKVRSLKAANRRIDHIVAAEFGGYDMVYPSVSCFEGSDFRWLLRDPTWPEIADGNQASTVAMFRKAAWERVGGFRDWGKGDRYVPEDWEFWVRLIGHGFRGKSIREPL